MVALYAVPVPAAAPATVKTWLVEPPAAPVDPATPVPVVSATAAA
jgi:hypothetical protein